MSAETSNENKKPNDIELKKMEIDPDTRIQFAASKHVSDKKPKKQ